jgi:hypothetical protein
MMLKRTADRGSDSMAWTPDEQEFIAWMQAVSDTPLSREQIHHALTQARMLGMEADRTAAEVEEYGEF